ncbi:hypothetical protein [Desulfatibacillum aliphaticivorans]|uniref:hypothetical protein n=1 Tax=Desulfatibacillum aliphaticivorans TaxID=218208 RepID=UPI00042555DB|nr:hypothetical protein [Desulfatibacillum aliphaticivorans]
MKNDHKDEKDIWFPAKKYGWGWGIPLTWQGWAVMVGYMLLMTVGAVFLTRPPHEIWFLPFTVIATALLIFICWKKGEKPQWRWGKKD